MRRSFVVPAALIATSVLARLVAMQWLRPLNWDEIEFFRATSWVRQGLVPYRDFWEHHTPLQWFLFAPFTALIDSPGVSAVIALRWAQVPLWIATFWLLNVWMREAGLDLFARWAAMALALTSSLLMLPAVEYRVDVLGNALLLLGIVLLQRMERGVAFALGAGAAFALAGFANLRLGPALVLVMLFARITRLGEGRWGGSTRANWIFAGAAVTTLCASLYFVATHSLGDAIRHVWTENYLTDRLQPNVPGMFFHRILAPFGLRLLRAPGESAFAASGIDPGGALLVVLGAIGLVRALARWRKPDFLFFLAFVEVVSILFTGTMKFVFIYHMEGLVLLAVPLVAVEIERVGRPRLIIAVLIAAMAMNVSVALFRGKEDDLAYQNLIMREVDRRTPAGGRVFDGSGWALRREPAYRYWFLRHIVFELERHGEFAPYVPADPPAAMIADHDARMWLVRHPPLLAFAVTNYLPLWRDLWLPGLSARLLPGQSAQWAAPRGPGELRLFASPRLASHPWFRMPLEWNRRMWFEPGTALTDADHTDDVVVERTGGRIVATNRGSSAVGVFLIRGNPAELFRQPPPGVSLEASSAPRWHVPHLGYNAPP